MNDLTKINFLKEYLNKDDDITIMENSFKEIQIISNEIKTLKWEIKSQNNIQLFSFFSSSEESLYVLPGWEIRLIEYTNEVKIYWNDNQVSFEYIPVGAEGRNLPTTYTYYTSSNLPDIEGIKYPALKFEPTSHSQIGYQTQEIGYKNIFHEHQSAPGIYFTMPDTKTYPLIIEFI